MDHHPIITLTTDFGIQDNYVGTMKGVILGINPRVTLVDITHQVSPQDILEAAFLLESSRRYFPSGTIHVAVVDPGVGSRRRPIVVKTKEYLYVGPDNGLFSPIYEDEAVEAVIEITNQRYIMREVSHTFHGRDIFAPAAGWLSTGIEPRELGGSIADFVRLPLPSPRVLSNEIQGQVLHVDRFGNVVTNISRELFERVVGNSAFRILAGRTQISSINRSYMEVDDGKLLAIFGSSHRLEISIRGGSAHRDFGLSRGEPVTVKLSEDR